MPKLMPHETMYEWAMSDEEFIDTVVTKEGDVLQITRRLTVAERIALLKGCAAFYAPTLKSVEAKGTLDLDSMDLDQLKAKVITLMAKTINDERKSH